MASTSPALASYLGILREANAPSTQPAAAPAPDVTPPTAPTGLVLLANGLDFLTVGWSPSTDNVAVAGYEYFLDGTSVGKTPDTTAVISQLPCGTTFTVGVETYDAAGNHSAPTSFQAGTMWGCASLAVAAAVAAVVAAAVVAQSRRQPQTLNRHQVTPVHHPRLEVWQ